MIWKFQPAQRDADGVVVRPAQGICHCGKTLILTGESGLVQCPECGQWYSTSGQEALPPDIDGVRKR